MSFLIFVFSRDVVGRGGEGEREEQGGLVEERMLS